MVAREEYDGAIARLRVFLDEHIRLSDVSVPQAPSTAGGFSAMPDDVGEDAELHDQALLPDPSMGHYALGSPLKALSIRQYQIARLADPLFRRFLPRVVTFLESSNLEGSVTEMDRVIKLFAHVTDALR